MSSDTNGTDAKAAQREARIARAERYLNEDLKGQRDWYSARASKFKRRAQLFSLAVLIAGSLTSVVQAFGPHPWAPVVTAVLGGLVVVAEGWQRIARYTESWTAYRLASERIKREYRLYANGAGAYRTLGDEDEAFIRFVESIEHVLAEEQQIFWRQRGSEPQSGKGEPPATDATGEAKT